MLFFKNYFNIYPLFQHYIYLTLHPHILIKNISAVLDVEDNETYPTRFAVYAGSAKNQKQMVEDIKLKSNKTLIKLLGRQEEVNTIRL